MLEKVFETKYGNIHYWTSDVFDKEKKSLVFLPGLTADHRLFDKQIEYFQDKFNLFVWDAPGHASSRPFELKFLLDDKAKWLFEILQKEGILKPILVGQSMGGYVSQVFLNKFPNTISGFISIDSAPIKRSYYDSVTIWLLKHTRALYSPFSWKSLLKYGSIGVATTEYGQTLMKQMMLEYDKNPSEYYDLVVNGYDMLSNTIEKNIKVSFDCPVLLICGQKDMAGSSRAYNKKWAKEEGYPIKWIEGAGHNSNSDKPDEINNLILEFVEDIK